MMEKRGVIDDKTPLEHGCCGGKCKQQDTEKQAADRREEHLTTRLAKAVAETSKPTGAGEGA